MVEFSATHFSFFSSHDLTYSKSSLYGMVVSPYFLWLTSYCKSMSSKIIINTLLSIDVLVCRSFHISFGPCFSIRFSVHGEFSMESIFHCGRNIVHREKIWYHKMCFQFSFAFFFSCWAVVVQRCMFSCLTNFISIKHHFIHNLFCARAQLLCYDGKCRLQWNEMVCWKLDEKEQTKIFDRKVEKKKMMNLEIDHISCSNTLNHTVCAVGVILKKIFLFLGKSDEDPTHSDPSTITAQEWNYVQIDTFSNLLLYFALWQQSKQIFWHTFSINCLAFYYI